MSDPTQRFSSRVEAYIKYRPSYPAELFDALARECALSDGATIADIGSGTGISAAPLLRRGYHVYGIEPNEPMRLAAEALLGAEPNFVSQSGRAEETGLPAQSVELVFAAQAFHWFERAGARREFQRILRTSGHVALVWNDRLTEGTPFLAAYERLLRSHAVDYAAVNHRDTVSESAIAEFFAPAAYRTQGFANHQDFDLDGLIGRARSSSYVPEPGHPEHDAFYAELERIFAAHAHSGRVRFEYVTRLFWGGLSG
jgi:SAM-dependent methyltransferase